MKRYIPYVLVLFCTGGPVSIWAAKHNSVGIELGKDLFLKPQVEISGGYNNRAFYSTTGEPRPEFFSDVGVSTELANRPAVYNGTAKGRYGIRISDQANGTGDDFYTIGGSIGTQKKPLLWNIVSDFTKVLDYNVIKERVAGQDPRSILTYRANTRLTMRFNTEYDWNLSSKTALIPSYEFYYNQQEIKGYKEASEWKEHDATIRLLQQYSAKTRIWVGAESRFQVNRRESGVIGTTFIGIRHNATEKTSWLSQIGYAVGNYEKSGQAQGVVTKLLGNWQTTRKVSIRVFGRNDFYPGYGGGAARMVYRIGYGANWHIAEEFSVKVFMLHDYQSAIGDNTNHPSVYGKVRHFFSLNAEYRPSDRISLIASFRYNQDEFPDSQTRLYLQTIYRFY